MTFATDAHHAHFCCGGDHQGACVELFSRHTAGSNQKFKWLGDHGDRTDVFANRCVRWSQRIVRKLVGSPLARNTVKGTASHWLHLCARPKAHFNTVAGSGELAPPHLLDLHTIVATFVIVVFFSRAHASSATLVSPSVLPNK